MAKSNLQSNLPRSTKTPTKLVFDDNEDVAASAASDAESAESGSGSGDWIDEDDDEHRAPSSAAGEDSDVDGNDDIDNSNSDSDSGVEEVSLAATRSAVERDIKRRKESEKSKKLEAKAIHEKRAAKGRELNLEKLKKKAQVQPDETTKPALVAAKDAKSAIDLSVFAQADKDAKSKQETVAAKKRIFNDSDDVKRPAKKERPNVSAVRQISGFNVVPLDSEALRKPKASNAKVIKFQKNQLYGERIPRKNAVATMAQRRDGAIPNFVSSKR
ncbi:hypothetical protein HDU84_002825 [Entophlyctis sp. JEL0112]|nr:hypothetical protein HDU84_002825 [Entophlyctis sp. JEL0112]